MHSGEADVAQCIGSTHVTRAGVMFSSVEMALWDERVWRERRSLPPPQGSVPL